MARLTWVPGVLRAAGLTVHEYPGWQTRGASGWSLDAINPAGVLCHATAGATNGNESGELNVIANGRQGLAGPIAQTFLQRNGHWTMVAAGVANHAGSGGLWGVSGNNRVIGVEASNDNRGEPWPQAQYDSYVRGVAAMLRYLNLPASRAGAHREWSTTGKTDPVGINMTTFRSQVAAVLAGTMEEPDMEPSTVVPLPDNINYDGYPDGDPTGWPTTGATGQPTLALLLHSINSNVAAIKQIALGEAARHNSLIGEVDQVEEMLAAIQAGDPAAVADAVVARLGPAQAQLVADTLYARLAP